MHLVYLNGDRTLHDCGDMDEKNIHFSDLIKVRRDGGDVVDRHRRDAL